MCFARVNKRYSIKQHRSRRTDLRFTLIEARSCTRLEAFIAPEAKLMPIAASTSPREQSCTLSQEEETFRLLRCTPRNTSDILYQSYFQRFRAQKRRFCSSCRLREAVFKQSWRGAPRLSLTSSAALDLVFLRVFNAAAEELHQPHIHQSSSKAPPPSVSRQRPRE